MYIYIYIGWVANLSGTIMSDQCLVVSKMQVGHNIFVQWGNGDS